MNEFEVWQPHHNKHVCLGGFYSSPPPSLFSFVLFVFLTPTCALQPLTATSLTFPSPWTCLHDVITDTWGMISIPRLTVWTYSSSVTRELPLPHWLCCVHRALQSVCSRKEVVDGGSVCYFGQNWNVGVPSSREGGKKMTAHHFFWLTSVFFYSHFAYCCFFLCVCALLPPVSHLEAITSGLGWGCGRRERRWGEEVGFLCSEVIASLWRCRGTMMPLCLMTTNQHGQRQNEGLEEGREQTSRGERVKPALKAENVEKKEEHKWKLLHTNESGSSHHNSRVSSQLIELNGEISCQAKTPKPIRR